MPLISQTTEYAIRAMIELARQPDDGALLARELTEKTGVPQFYLSKILHALARHRLLTSIRGRGGGFRLSRPASEITLAMVVEHFEDLRSNSECLLGRPRCSDAEACPMHEFWKEMRERYVKELETRTLADLAAHEELWQSERCRIGNGSSHAIAAAPAKPGGAGKKTAKRERAPSRPAARPRKAAGKSRAR